MPGAFLAYPGLFSGAAHAHGCSHTQLAHIDSRTPWAAQVKTTEHQNNLELSKILPSPWGADAGTIFSETLGAWRWLWLFLLLPNAAFGKRIAPLVALKEQ